MLTARETPLYEIKANLFKGLAHPARIRILEILADSPGQSCPVSELLEGTGLEASHLSQHLATLRRHRVVTSVRTANTVTYSLAHPTIAELLAIARTFLLDTLADTRAQLEAASALPALGAAASSTAPAAASTTAHDGGAR
ncbi:metalloregulator ArsR/SmtB family transcription factor [Sinomonas sp. R1AF57]|uniref:ArsR/SmtB family transcription factor n=1 Tax=Sinomonas sp. R1AF57 TaxID=2020377 RepID=UPI000B5ECCC4|nr:metalloregulator ArsR/SmtB family transcription factor [Sinomonas sp. R1AF57]ASN52750.1 transcriptional regulator [Sinomonas sp. R1AF57]